MPRSHALLPIVLGPPPEVREEIGEAWERAQEAAVDVFELHFESCGDADLRPPLALAV